jgi:hypothetical protein
MLRFLDELEASSNEAMSLYLPPGLPPPQVEDLLEKALVSRFIVRDITGLVTGSQTGAALFWGTSRRCLVLPPFPLTDKYIATTCDVEPLRSLLEAKFGIALLLVRLGAFAIGVCQGDKLVASKTGTGLVHARHKKGGSSQRRFERHREKQVETFLGRVCGHVRQHLEPYATSLDYLVYGGARTTIHSLQEQCLFLKQFENRTLPPLLDIPGPRRSVLESAIGTIWSSSVTEWYEDPAIRIDS